MSLNDHTLAGSHADDIKVLIFLSDGNKQLLTQGQMDALNATMQANNIYVFPITYNQNPVSGQAIVQMNALAQGSATGSKGKLYTAKNAAELDLVFGQIYDMIMQLANEKTQMSLVFQDIEVNDQTYTGNDLYDYIPVDIPAGLEPGISLFPAAR